MQVQRESAVLDIKTPAQLWKFVFAQRGPQVLFVTLVLASSVKAAVWGWSAVELLVVGVVFLGRGFIEWGVHCYIMHAAPLPLLGLRIKTSIYYMHQHHHQNPDDVFGVLFKGRSVAALLVAVFSVSFLISFQLAMVLLVCVAMCLFMYELFHVASHSDLDLKTCYFRSILDLHRRHHTLQGKQCFGVSSSVADRLFNSAGSAMPGMARPCDRHD